jgi:hypothetical protein
MNTFRDKLGGVLAEQGKFYQLLVRLNGVALNLLPLG